MWTRFEPVHAVAYFAPHTREAFERAGVRGFWRTYLAGRAAPLGRTGPGPVHAAFQGFSHEMVARAVPSVWDLIEPEEAWHTRTEACATSVAQSCDGIGSDELVRAADVLRRVALALDPVGRPFFAAHLDLSWPNDVHAGVWHACTLLREHRGDGYVAACVVHDVTALDLMLIAEHTGTVPAGHAADNRGWPPDAIDAAAESLRSRGLLDGDGTPTTDAIALRALIESTTDRLATRPWDELDTAELDTVAGVLDTVSRNVADRGWITYPNPVGVGRPDPR